MCLLSSIDEALGSIAVVLLAMPTWTDIASKSSTEYVNQSEILPPFAALVHTYVYIYIYILWAHIYIYMYIYIYIQVHMSWASTSIEKLMHLTHFGLTRFRQGTCGDLNISWLYGGLPLARSRREQAGRTARLSPI